MHQPPSEDPKKQRKPAIRPRHHVPGGPTGSPDHALRRLDESERLEQALLHELAGLLDGSTRFLRLALRELRSGDLDALAAAAAINHLGAAESALGTMAGMIQRTRASADDRQHPRYIVAPQPVHTAIDAAVAHTQHIAASQGIRIFVNVEASALRSPPLPLYPVLSNGIRNAIEAHTSAAHTPEDAFIRVRAYTEDESDPVLILEITDNGPGLSAELATDPQLALSLGYTNRACGSGVGLALCADIVSSIGGSLSLHTLEPRGAMLRAEIPFRQDEPDSGGIG